MRIIVAQAIARASPASRFARQVVGVRPAIHANTPLSVDFYQWIYNFINGIFLDGEEETRREFPISIISRSFSCYNDFKKGGNLFLPRARIGKDVSFGNYLSIIHRQKTWILHHQLITRLSKRFVDRKLLSSIEFRRVKYSEEEGNCGEKIWERKIGGRLKVGGRQTLNFPT